MRIAIPTHLRRRFLACGILAAFYLVAVRWLLLDYLHSQEMLGWYTALIEKLNAGRVNYGTGPHPLEEYRQRADIFLFQLCTGLAALRLSWWILCRKSRILLLVVYATMMLLVLLGFDAFVSTEAMQRRFGSVQYERVDIESLLRHRRSENSLGFTDRERSPRKAEGVFRIVVLGDSFVWGDGLEDLDDVWSHILASKIESKYSHVEVVSWGKNGWSTTDQLEFLRGRAAEFEVDLMVIGYSANDSHIPGVSMARRLFIWQRVVRRSPIAANALRLICKRANGLLYATPYFQNWGYDGWRDSLYSADNLLAYRTVLRDLRDHLGERKIDFFFVTMPPPGAIADPFHDEYRLIFEIFDDLGVRYLDLLPRFLDRFGDFDTQKIKDELWASPVNAHPARPITEFYADSVVNYLETKQLLPRPERKRNLR